jgi:hypothetical protein
MAKAKKMKNHRIAELARNDATREAELGYHKGEAQYWNASAKRPDHSPTQRRRAERMAKVSAEHLSRMTKDPSYDPSAKKAYGDAAMSGPPPQSKKQVAKGKDFDRKLDVARKTLANREKAPNNEPKSRRTSGSDYLDRQYARAKDKPKGGI